MGKIPRPLWNLLRPWLVRKGYIKVKIIRRQGIINTHLVNIKNKEEISLEGRTRNIKPDSIMLEAGWPVLIYHEENPNPIPRHADIKTEIPPGLYNQLLQEHYEAGYLRAKHEMRRREQQATLILLAAVGVVGFMLWSLYTQQQQLTTQIQNMMKEIAKIAAAMS